MSQPLKLTAERRGAGIARRSFFTRLAGVSALAAHSLRAQPAPTARDAGAAGKTSSAAAEIKEYRDPETRARVVQLTGDGSDNVHLYFTSESFLDGGSDRIVFGSNRSGRFQFYLLEIGAKRLVQLTARDNVRPTQACMAPNGRLYYFDGPALRALDVDKLDDRELYRVPEGFVPRLPTCTTDGRYVAFAYGEKMAVSTESGRIYSSMFETYFQRPASVIMRIETGSGQPVAVWGERMWISHVLINPVQPDCILFCHEGGSMVRQRMWTVNVAKARGRKAVPLYPQRPGEFCVHEYFTRQGEVGFQYEVEREGRIEQYNAYIRTDGSWIRQYLLPGPRPGHIQSNSDNTLVVGDRGFLSEGDRDGSNYMSLMTHHNGRAQVRRLCKRVPGETQYSHGHPVFSGDNRWVLFNSRIGPRENIAMADVQSL
ncbi:MAG: oligogalacturonate lyase family protein [Bryobacteraceae bacterium]|nr:oligogalacturonate lyase family protein [Bryobacteraceae bacterium]